MLINNYKRHKRVYVLDGPNIAHHELSADVRALRQKGWPIEDEPMGTPGIGTKHGYRLDPERMQGISV